MMNDDLKGVISTPGPVFIDFPASTFHASWWGMGRDGDEYATELFRLGSPTPIPYAYGIVRLEKGGRYSAMLSTADVAGDPVAPDVELGTFGTIREAVYAVRMHLLMDQLMEDK